jgi:hypothetical protein
MVKSSLSAPGLNGPEKRQFPDVSADKYALATNFLAELSRI